MVIAGALDLGTSAMVHGALLAMRALLLAAPTAITGLMDGLALARGTAVRRVATMHLGVTASTSGRCGSAALSFVG